MSDGADKWAGTTDKELVAAHRSACIWIGECKDEFDASSPTLHDTVRAAASAEVEILRRMAIPATNYEATND